MSRINIREILNNPSQRRELMIRAIISIQAIEGIEMTRERAEEVYDRHNGAVIQEAIIQASQQDIPRDEFIRMMFGMDYSHEIARQICSVQPMPSNTLEPLRKFLADGGAIRMSCDSFTGRQKPKQEE